MEKSDGQVFELWWRNDQAQCTWYGMKMGSNYLNGTLLSEESGIGIGCEHWSPVTRQHSQKISKHIEDFARYSSYVEDL